MKKIQALFKNIAVLAILLVAIVSCEREFTNLGTGIAGTNNFTTEIIHYPVITYNKPTGPIQSNNLSSYLLGYYEDLTFGSTTAGVVAQVSTSNFNPNFGDNIVLDSVILTIPYFSTPTETDADGNNTYRLDSVIGDAPIKLSIFQNNFFLRDFDPNSDIGDAQPYYSNGSTDESSIISQSDLEHYLLYENNEFLPDSKEIILKGIDATSDTDDITETSRLRPSMRLRIDNEDNADYWNDVFFSKQDGTELSNSNNFLDYFRGLYFKTEGLSDEGTMMLLDFLNSDTSFNIYFSNDYDENDDDEDGIPNYADVDIDGDGNNDNGTDDDEDGINDEYDSSDGGTDDDDDGIIDINTSPLDSFDMTFSGNVVNILNNNIIPIPGGDEINGDEKLYLKGAAGSMAVINLFEGDENGESVWLDDFKSKNWLINEANLVFHVDQDMIQGSEPDRLYIYDLKNRTALVDYFLDQSVSDTQISAKIDHLEPLTRVDDDPDGNGIKYRIKITEHLNNILLRDSTNVQLGLVVSANVNAIDNLRLQNQEGQTSTIVSGALLSPLSTVVHGNKSSNPEKKVWLEIYYTEPDQ